MTVSQCSFSVAGMGAWRDRDQTTSSLTHPLIFTFMTSNFPPGFVLLNFWFANVSCTINYIGLRVGSCWVFITNPFISPHQQSVLQSTIVSTGLPQPFSSKQQKKNFQVSNRKRKCQPFLNLLVLFLELSGRCGASTRRSCGNVTFDVNVGVLCIKRGVSSVTKKHEDGRSTEKER